VDDGTAWEIGYFYAKKSPEQKIIGIRTDFPPSKGSVADRWLRKNTKSVRVQFNL
jgi:nucleoside 2-deoxyribosyltransferase